MQDRAAETQEGARIAAPSSDAGTPRLSNRARERIAGYLFVAPDAIGLLIFVGGPMVLSLSLGFFSVSGFGEYTFVGLANYRRMMADPLFWRSIEVTVLYVVAFVPSLYVVGLGLALLVAVELALQHRRAQPAVHAADGQPRRRRARLAGAARRQDRPLQPVWRERSICSRSPGSAIRASPSSPSS